jgi:formylglycine-generating enzyme required for sulfatase activity
MAAKVFISYRREQANWQAREIYRAFKQVLPPDHVFMDIDSIPPGVDFVEFLEDWVERCDVMLVLIGEGWAEGVDKTERRRLENPDDFVRIEVRKGLARGIPVVPVLLDRAQIPDAGRLPDDLLRLVRRNAEFIDHRTVDTDVERLIKRLRLTDLHAQTAPGAPVVASSRPRPEQQRLAREADESRPAEEAEPRMRETEAKEQARQKAADAEKRIEAARRQKETDVARRVEPKTLDETKKAGRALRVALLIGGAATAVVVAAALVFILQSRAPSERPSVAAAPPTATAPSRATEAEAKRVDEEAARRDPALSVTSGSGKSFQDRLADGTPCPMCPEMVVVPAGKFTMGSPPGERDRDPGEVQVPVTIARPFAVGKFAVTFDQWDACAADGGCNGYRPADQGWGRGNRPVIYVNWSDANAYVAWLSQKTGKTYRLLSEAEREYVTRAGTTTTFWWGYSISTNQANYNGNYTYARGSKGENRQRLVPVDSFTPNPWGLFNVHGNVWEWTADCWNANNEGNPGDGTARTTGNCDGRVIRGGFWNNPPRNLRAANRYFAATDHRDFAIGFRLARTLNP